MARLCERPGCSEVASVAYGMQPEDLVFWLDHLGPSYDEAGGLCRRHADAMVVPRGWTLNDLRDPDLHLFRPPVRDDTGSLSRPRGRRGAAGRAVEQLALDGIAPPPDPAGAAPAVVPAVASTADDLAQPPSPDLGTADSGDPAWAPSFDVNDDLDGVLAARSPLLARAFRGHDRDR